jgi:hypothetical protein
MNAWMVHPFLFPLAHSMRAPNPIVVGVSTLRRKHANGHRRGGKTTAQAYAEIAARSGALLTGAERRRSSSVHANKLLLAREIARGLLRNVVSFIIIGKEHENNLRASVAERLLCSRLYTT